MTTADIELKGLSREQVSNLLPEGLISLCWRGSVAHGMYVPKSDPDSIDDKDVMGVYIGPLEHYLGFGRRDVYEKWEGEGLRLLRTEEVCWAAAQL
jgi:RNA repair pathway DNA polymerase beta family